MGRLAHLAFNFVNAGTPKPMTRMSGLLVRSSARRLRMCADSCSGAGAYTWGIKVQGRGPFTRHALFLAVVVLVGLMGLSRSASANHSLWAWVSGGQINGNGDFDATYGGVSADGLHDF